MSPSKNNLAIDQKVAALKIHWKSYSKILTKACVNERKPRQGQISKCPKRLHVTVTFFTDPISQKRAYKYIII